MTKLTPAEITSLCDAAAEAWKALGPRGRRAKFTWRGKTYVATHTLSALCVDTLDGKPVAKRYD